MVNEIYHNDIFRSKLNTMEQENEHTGLLPEVRFVTKEFKESNDPLEGTSLMGKYLSFNPKKFQRNNLFESIYNNYMWEIWVRSGKPVNCEISYADSLILYELDCLSALEYISAQGYANRFSWYTENLKSIKRCYPDFNGEDILKEFDKEFIHYKDLDFAKYSKIKLGLDLNRCKDDAILNLANQKWSRFRNEAQDKDIELVSQFQDKILAEAVKVGILTEELHEPVFFTTANPDISPIQDRLRLLGQKLSIYTL